ncbi:ammonium transporter AmtB-like domain-containing protein [Phyllosticta citriasiana]|uniref:ammonium transporter AmtB-like domain-containing protein n=1 Tax=Phyllosticta citriasiana TaxID=595635 RepID=UPI0030FD91F8
MSATTGLPYVPLQAFPTDAPATGGDSLTEDLNVYYKSGDISWILASTALVLLMIPGVGFFYSGLARRKSALSLIWLSIMATAVVSFQWFFWGYSLAFSHSAGNHCNPDLLFACGLAVGAVAERGRMLPCVIYMFVWSTIIYDPIACWTWNPAGWAASMGSIDFAGGTPVHIASGCAALAYSYMLGKRTQLPSPQRYPHRLGTVFLWVGWFGFNAGSAGAANLRAVMAAVVTNLAACVGGITWCLIDYRLEKKWSTVGFCSGVIAGLIAITLGAFCNYATKLKYFLRADDALDIFAVHGVGGFVGNILTAFFAAHTDSIAGGAYAFGGTCIILGVLGFLGNYVSIFRLRVSEEEEVLGIDDCELGEFAYDYVEVSHISDSASHHSMMRTASHDGHEKTHDSLGSENVSS